jgi:hypothetical protein
MPSIPTLEELDGNRPKTVPTSVTDEVRKFSVLIIEAMQKKKSKLQAIYLMPTKAAQEQLRTDFAAFGWTLSFSKIRIGGSISWS